MGKAHIPLPCLGALPLLYPAAPPSVFAKGKYTAPAVALVRDYLVHYLGILPGVFLLCVDVNVAMLAFFPHRWRGALLLL